VQKTYQDYMRSNEIRKKSILAAAEAFLSKGGSVFITEAKSNEPLSSEQFDDLAALEKILTEKQYSNVGVMVGR